MTQSHARFDRLLKQAFEAGVHSKKGVLTFSADTFFSQWFRKLGTPYYFLFHKNLSVTNIQFAELVSLIRLHTTNRGNKQPEKSLHFVVVKEFLKGMQEVVDDLAKSRPTKRVLRDTFLNLYAEVLRHMVLLDVFHGSCSVFFPPHMRLNLFKVCSESGYIHSTGHSVYAREFSIADDEDFKRALTSYIKRKYPREKVFFVVYAHEDFTKDDRDHASQLRGGLDDVKVYVEKYFLGNKPLVHVLRELQASNNSRLFLASAGSYKKHRDQITKNSLLKDQTIWLIIDRIYPSDERFLICYDQCYKNASPLHLFDENKPAWTAHTTIPHTLSGAMLNITRPLWPKRNVKIYDPFCGTGTTVLEALKFNSVHITCNDTAPIAPLLLQDNLAFFASTKERLKEIEETLTRLSNAGAPEYGRGPESRQQQSPYSTALSLIDDVVKTNGNQSIGQWFDVHKNAVARLEKMSFENRLPFYLALRTELRHVAALDRGNDQWVKAYCEEISILLFQVKGLSKLRAEKLINTSGKLDQLTGIYSDWCTIKPQTFDITPNKSDRLTFRNKDARIHPGDKFDLVITDPPYGFNNDLNTINLAGLLTKTLDVLFKSLKPNGQMVIALPDKSHSGRRIPLFATRIWVTEQIIAKAEEHGFEAVIPANILPRIGNLFQPPYYWNSEKALKRVILHFQFRQKKRPRKGSP